MVASLTPASFFHSTCPFHQGGLIDSDDGKSICDTPTHLHKVPFADLRSNYFIVTLCPAKRISRGQYLVAQEEAGKLIRTRLEFILLTGAHKGALPGWIQIGSPTPAAPAEEQVERQLKYRFVRVQLDIVVELKRLL